MRDYNQPCIVIDMDGTLCPTKAKDECYWNLPIDPDTVLKLQEYAYKGWYIIICTARQERTYEGNLGQRTAKMLPVLVQWLCDNYVPFDEIRIDKPWHGYHGFCVDDKTVPPLVFIEKSSQEILETWLPSFAAR